MRLPSVPGPRDVWQLLERSADTIEQLLAAVPRVIVLIGEAEGLLVRVRGVVGDIEATRVSAQRVADETSGVVAEADVLLQSLIALDVRAARLLESFEPHLVTLQPVLEELARTTSPREVDALVGLLDQLPELADKLQTDVLPMLQGLRTVAPDVHDLLDVSRELNGILGHLPGMGKIKRRIDEEQEAEGRG